MELTPEQKERIQQNRERALEIQRQRQRLQLTSTDVNAKDNSNNNSTTIHSPTKHGLDANHNANESNVKRMKQESSAVLMVDGIRNSSKESTEKDEDVDDTAKYHTDEIEAFEENASEYVTKQEAMRVYCLPLGTLDVCQNCITKPNPKHATWSNMKLYLRKEIRYRAHQRYGGMMGLIEERNRRNQARLQKDMEQSKDIFK
jgi:DNA-repair protein complementing XP-A cells